METIIGLLFILLPLIFKLIGRKFEQSGQTDRAGKMRELAKALGSDEDSEDNPFKGFFEGQSEPEVVFDDDGQIVEVKPVASRPDPEPVKTNVGTSDYLEAVQRMTKQKVSPFRPVRKQNLLQEEDTSRKKSEKIDPKKLVIYSEIMKPKF